MKNYVLMSKRNAEIVVGARISVGKTVSKAFKVNGGVQVAFLGDHEGWLLYSPVQSPNTCFASIEAIAEGCEILGEL